jgi:hypothetical protein
MGLVVLLPRERGIGALRLATRVKALPRMASMVLLEPAAPDSRAEVFMMKREGAQ